MSLRARVLTGIRWTATARLLSQVVAWAVTLVVIRILSPEDYGLVAMCMVFVAFVTMFSQFGLGAALVQVPELDETLLRQVFGAILAINLSLAALLALAAPLIGAFYDEPRVVPLLRALSLQFVFAAFWTIPDAQLQRRMEFRNRSLLELSSAILSSLTTLGLALAGAGAWSLIIGSLASQLWNTIGIQRLSPFLHRPDFSFGRVRRLLSHGGQSTLANVFATIYSQMDILICAKLLGKEIVGFYSVAMHVASMPVHRLSVIVNQVAFPAFSSIQHDLRDVAEKSLLGVRLLSFLTLPVMWGISSVAPEFVEVIFGSKWAPAVLPLQVLAFVLPMRMVLVFLASAVSGLGRFDIFLQNSVWTLAVGSSLFFAGTYWGGLTGLSVAWLFVPLTVAGPALARVAPAIGLRFMEILSAIGRPAAAGLVMYCVVIAARQLMADGPAPVLRLVALVAAGAIAYCAASFVLNRNGTLEFVGMMRSVVKPTRT